MDDGNGLLFALLAVVVVAAAVGIFLWRRRVGYIRSLTDRGWTFDSTPSLGIAAGLNVPPFGLGFDRDTDEHIAGVRAGVPFSVFEYKSAATGRCRVATMRLQLPLPELFLTTGRPRGGAAAAGAPAAGPWQVFADDAAFAQAFQAATSAAVAAFAQACGGIDLSVDRDRLVVLNAPKEAAELERFLDLMAAVARAVDPAAFGAFRRPAHPPYLSFYRRPAWEFRQRDDSLMNVVAVTTNGKNHRILNVVTSAVGPLPFVAFEHHWQTTRTETYTDSNGNTQTRTVTENHREDILELALSFDTPYLEVTGNRMLGKWFGRGDRVEFELHDFNRTFDVRSTSPKFASDVIHPRQIEYLMHARPLPFAIENRRVRVDVATHSLQAIDHTLAVMTGFFARVPEFVWQDLGVPVPDFDGDGRPGPTLYSSDR